MSIFDKLLDLIKAVVKKLVNAVIEFVKEHWYIIVIAAVIWYAPGIALWLGNAGAPSFLTSAFTWTATTLTPLLQTGLTFVYEGVASVAAEAWAGFTAASLGTQAAIVFGAAAMIAPEETEALLTETVETFADLTVAAAGAVGSSLLKHPITWIVLGTLGYLLLAPSFGSAAAGTTLTLTGEDEDAL